MTIQVARVNTTSHKIPLTNYAKIYTTLHFQLCMNVANNIMKNDVVTTVPTQYHVSKEVKVFGQDGIDAVLAEFKQLQNRVAMNPTNLSNVLVEEKQSTLQYFMLLYFHEKKQSALQYLMLLKPKRCGSIKVVAV